MIHFKYDINNHNNTDIINKNYYIYTKELNNNKDVAFLNKMFLYLLYKNNYNLIKKLINDTININKNPFRYDYKNIYQYNIENQKKNMIYFIKIINL